MIPRCMSDVWREQKAGTARPRRSQPPVRKPASPEGLKLTAASVAEQNIKVLESDIFELLSMKTEDLPGAVEMLTKLQNDLARLKEV